MSCFLFPCYALGLSSAGVAAKTPLLCVAAAPQMFLLWLVVFTFTAVAWAVNCFAEKLRTKEEQVHSYAVSRSLVVPGTITCALMQVTA